MAVVIGADSQMFVLWKETRDPFNLNHSTWERMLRSRDPERMGKHTSVDHLVSLKDGVSASVFGGVRESEGWTVSQGRRAQSAWDCRQPLRKKETSLNSQTWIKTCWLQQHTDNSELKTQFIGIQKWKYLIDIFLWLVFYHFLFYSVTK